MKREYEIHCYHDNIDDVAEIAFTSGKNTCGLVMSNDCVHIVYGHGNHSDAVRVYAALKANNIQIVFLRGV